MTTDLLDWHEEDQTVDPEAEYRMLLNGLRRTEGFGLFFVQCSPFGGEQIIQRVRKDLGNRPLSGVVGFAAPKGLGDILAGLWLRLRSASIAPGSVTDLADESVSVLRLKGPIADGNVFKRIRNFLDTQTETQVLFIQGLELSLLDYEESKKRLGWSSEKIFSYSWQGVPPVLINLNQQRERFRDSFHTRLVFLLPIFAVKYLVHRAPDFFDWRSGVAQFTDDADTLSRELKRIWRGGDYRRYMSWTQAQRNRRVLEIQSLLETEGVETQYQYNLYFEQGNLFDASEEWEAAIAAYDAALKIKPDDHEALNNKGIALDELGRYEDAIAAYDAALKIKPDDHEALNNKGVVLGNLGRCEDEIAAYDAILKIKPDDHEALYNKGLALRKLGRYEDAIATYDTALKIKPDDHEALYNKGNALDDLGRHEDAIATYDAALKIKPDDHEALYNKGVALDDLGRHEDAIAAYDAVLKVKPDNHEALYNKACAYALQNQIDSALENLAKAIQLKPNENRELAKTDSDFDTIRDDPRFQTLLTEQLE